jgi:hypothetical protein
LKQWRILGRPEKGLIFHPENLLKLYGKDEFSRGIKKMLSVMEPKEKREMMDQFLKALTSEEKAEIKRELK